MNVQTNAPQRRGGRKGSREGLPVRTGYTEKNDLATDGAHLESEISNLKSRIPICVHLCASVANSLLAFSADCKSAAFVALAPIYIHSKPCGYNYLPSGRARPTVRHPIARRTPGRIRRLRAIRRGGSPYLPLRPELVFVPWGMLPGARPRRVARIRIQCRIGRRVPRLPSLRGLDRHPQVLHACLGRALPDPLYLRPCRCRHAAPTWMYGIC
jgi:hypothetical protein